MLLDVGVEGLALQRISALGVGSLGRKILEGAELFKRLSTRRVILDSVLTRICEPARRFPRTTSA